MARRASALQNPRPHRAAPPARKSQPAKRRHLRVVPTPSAPSRPAPGRSSKGAASKGKRAEAHPKTASQLLKWTACWALVAGFVFGLVLLNVFVAQGSFQLAELRKQVADEERQYRQMRYEVAKSESPEKVAEMAGRLGLVVPAEQEYILGRPRTLVPETGEPEEPADANMKALLEGP